MSSYGNAAASAAVVGAADGSASAADLTSRANALLAAVPAGNRIVTANLAGAGDGHTFVFEIESAPAAQVDGGLDPTTIVVQAFEFGGLDAFQANRDQAMTDLLALLPPGSFIEDMLFAGASKGARFMGLLVATSTGGVPPTDAVSEVLRFGTTSAIPILTSYLSPAVDAAPPAVSGMDHITAFIGNGQARLGIRHLVPGASAEPITYEVVENGGAVWFSLVVAASDGSYNEALSVGAPPSAIVKGTAFRIRVQGPASFAGAPPENARAVFEYFKS